MLLPVRDIFRDSTPHLTVSGFGHDTFFQHTFLLGLKQSKRDGHVINLQGWLIISTSVPCCSSNL